MPPPPDLYNSPFSSNIRSISTPNSEVIKWLPPFLSVSCNTRRLTPCHLTILMLKLLEVSWLPLKLSLKSLLFNSFSVTKINSKMHQDTTISVLQGENIKTDKMHLNHPLFEGARALRAKTTFKIWNFYFAQILTGLVQRQHILTPFNFFSNFKLQYSGYM